MMKRVQQALPFVSVFFLATILRVIFLNAKGVWVDEAYSAHLARIPLSELVRKLSFECTPPLYYVLLALWRTIVGSGEAAIRLFSVFCSLSGLVVLYAFVRRFFSEYSARTTILFFALSPLAIYYAQEARMYALLMTEAIILIACAVAYAEKGRIRLLIGVGLCSVAMMLTHTVGVWFVAAAFLSFFVLTRERNYCVSWCVMAVCVALAYAPWFVVLLKQVSSQETILRWFVPFWNARSIIGHLWDMVCAFGFGFYPLYIAMKQVVGSSEAVGALFLGLIIVGGVMTFRSRPVNRAYVYVLATLVFSLVFAIVYSVVVQPVFIPGRTEVYLLPFFLLLMSVGASHVPMKWVRQGIVVVYCLLAAITLPHYYFNPEKNGSRNYCSIIGHSATQKDLIVATGMTYAEVDYYLQQMGVHSQVVSYPCDTADHPGFFNAQVAAEDPVQLAADVDAIVHVCRDVIDGGGRIYVVMTPYDINTQLVKALSSEFVLAYASSDGFRQGLVKVPVRLFVYRK